MVQEGTGTIERVVQILRSFAESEGDLTVSGLARELGLPRSTVHRFLQILREQGMVEWEPGRRRYRAGLEFYRLGALIVDKVAVGDIARPVMQEVVAACDESCLLALYLPADGKMMFAEKVDPAQSLRYRLPMNRPAPLEWGASGRSILAFLPPAEIEQILANADSSPATGKPPSRETLLRELEQIRARGYDLTRGQKIPGAVGLGVPVFEPGGRVTGSLCLTIPEVRFEEDMEEELSKLLVSYARALSSALGARPEDGVLLREVGEDG